jgi:hypothetical protein
MPGCLQGGNNCAGAVGVTTEVFEGIPIGVVDRFGAGGPHQGTTKFWWGPFFACLLPLLVVHAPPPSILQRSRTHARTHARLVSWHSLLHCSSLD